MTMIRTQYLFKRKDHQYKDLNVQILTTQTSNVQASSSSINTAIIFSAGELQVSSDWDDRMGAKIKTQKNP